ncbi:MAG: UDP-N-acetylmuramoyl-L-alanine--D-glutamate ligase, partial [Candidatus Omnitrophota bacterium]
MIKDFKNKKVTVVGLARSGVAASLFLKDLGAKVYVTDKSNDSKIQAEAKELKDLGMTVETGSHTQDFIKNKDSVVLSPGIKSDALPVIWAEKFKIPIISEIELGSIFCKGKIIAITGTNGKTTVTTLIGKIIEASGKKAFILGNIGTAFCQFAKDVKQDEFVSLEVSSFQLERIINFKPFISVVLNLTSDHLDRYKNMQEYLEAKKNIFKNQDKSCWTILNYQDDAIKNLACQTQANVKFFNDQKDIE